MKATIVIGSARDNGNTDAQSQSVADALRENGIEVEMLRPYRMDIKHCEGCNRCLNEMSCHIKDDMQVIYDAFDDSDLFIVATPVYFSGPSSIIKQVIDRFQCRWVSVDEPETSKAVALLCNGGSRNPRFESVISVVRAFAIGTRCRWLGESLVEGTDDNDISKVSKEGYRFGSLLAKAIKEKD